MYLHALQSRVPQHQYTQRQCWDLFTGSRYARTLRPRSVQILEKVLLGDNGIEKRHFAIEDWYARDLDATELNRLFEREAPRLARQALEAALDERHLTARELDALFVCTCTGYLCPGVSGHVAEQIGMRNDALLHDVAGLGCGAAIPTLRMASNFLAAEPGARAAVVAVEICSAAFYLDDDPGVLISACLFGDGASASIWESQPAEDRHPWRAHSFQSLHVPEDRDLLRFENKDGKLRNRLDRTVPELAARAVSHLVYNNGMAPHTHLIAHSGGRNVIERIRESLPTHPLLETSEVLRNYGNMSSPSVMFALERHLEAAPSDGPTDLMLTAFGAGFSAHSCHLSRGV